MNPISMERVERTRNDILNVICSDSLTHEQKVAGLASRADSLLEVLNLPEGLTELMEKGIICDLNEGHAPLRPRYIVPDYNKLFRDGCRFLGLDAPKDLYEALNMLLIFYRHVPSVTNFPVFIGSLDTLLEPFVLAEDKELAKKMLRLFLINIDRTITDAFCHANIGPTATICGQMLLELERELQNAVPNMTLKYDPVVTPDAFAEEALKTQLAVAKPAFANHAMFSSELGEGYGIASCYNGLNIGGGSYTLVRMLLGQLADHAKDSEDFFRNLYPRSLEIMAAYMDERIRFIVEESGFFENNFLSREGFIAQENFSAMFGMVGLAECVNILMEKDGLPGRYGHSEEADNLGIKIMNVMEEFVAGHENKYCGGFNNRFMLHGQVGIDTDKNQTPNVRIPIGEEPEELSDHLMHCAKFHKYFPSGVGEIFLTDSTSLSNPAYLLDIVKGAFTNGVRYLTFHSGDSDVIRVTGYLAKKSEIEKLAGGTAVLQNTTLFGLGSVNNSKILERKRR